MEGLRNEIRHTKDGILVRLYNIGYGVWTLSAHQPIPVEAAADFQDAFTMVTYFDEVPYGRVGSEVVVGADVQFFVERSNAALRMVAEAFPDLINFVLLGETECGLFCFSEERLLLPDGGA